MDELELLKKTFLEEACDLLDDFERNIVEISSNERELLESQSEIFRVVHSIKGSGRAVGFNQLADVAHIYENILTDLTKIDPSLYPDLLSLSFQILDFFRESLESMLEDHSSVLETSKIEKNILSFQNRLDNPQQMNQAPPAEPTISDGPGFAIFDDEPTESDARDALPNIDMADSGSKKALPDPKAQKPDTNEAIRVSIAKIDRFLEATGELNIIQSMLSEMIPEPSDQLRKSLRQLTKTTKELQDSAMRLRLVPFSSLNNKLKRIVSETATILQKKVQFTINSQNAEIDKNILDQIRDPLVHLVRNAIDHGIEVPEERRQRGKSESGSIELNVYQQSGKLHLDLIDDGKGILVESIRNKAMEKHLISEGHSMTDHELIQLIFSPGFSTAEKVSDISGRGVGMDVVKTNIESIGGAVSVTSKRGAGSTFKVEIPQSMAIMDSLIIRVSDQRFVIPITQISESIEITNRNFKSGQAIGSRLLLRDIHIPLLDLRSILKLNPSNADEKGIAIVGQQKNDIFALRVDDIISRKQIVVKNLGQEIKNQEFFSGTTILGDGKPALILDINGIAEQRAA